MANKSDTKGDDRPRKPTGKLAKRATRDVRIAHQPQLNQLARDYSQATTSWGENTSKINSDYAGLNERLSQLPGQYEGMVGGIPDQFAQQSQAFMGGLYGAGLPASEQGAAAQLFGTTGQQTLASLASDRQRAAAYNQSAMREGELTRKYALSDLDQQMRDALSQLRDQRMAVYDQMQPEIIQRMDTLREEARQRQQDEALNALIMSLISNQGSRPPRKFKGKGKPDGTTDTTTDTTTDDVYSQRHPEGADVESASGTGLTGLLPQAQSLSDLPPWLAALLRQSWDQSYGPGNPWVLSTPYRQTDAWQNIVSRPRRRAMFNLNEPYITKLAPGLLGGQ